MEDRLQVTISGWVLPRKDFLHRDITLRKSNLHVCCASMCVAVPLAQTGVRIPNFNPKRFSAPCPTNMTYAENIFICICTYRVLPK